jgi:hypothetical protein
MGSFRFGSWLGGSDLSFLTSSCVVYCVLLCRNIVSLSYPRHLRPDLRHWEHSGRSSEHFLQSVWPVMGISVRAMCWTYSNFSLSACVTSLWAAWHAYHGDGDASNVDSLSGWKINVQNVDATCEMRRSIFQKGGNLRIRIWAVAGSPFPNLVAWDKITFLFHCQQRELPLTDRQSVRPFDVFWWKADVALTRFENQSASQ